MNHDPNMNAPETGVKNVSLSSKFCTIYLY